MRYKFDDKAARILEFIKGRGKESFQQFASTFDEEFHDAYHEWFPALKLDVYAIGPNICPDANKTLRRMWKEGMLRRVTGGNQYARQYQQPTYSHIYYLPDGGIGATFAEWCERTDRDSRGIKRIRFGRKRKRC